MLLLADTQGVPPSRGVEVLELWRPMTGVGTFLQAHDRFAQFHGTTEGELISWLRQILVSRLEKLIRHYCGTQRRDVRLERQLVVEPDWGSKEPCSS